MKIKFSGVLFSMALMFAIILGLIPGIDTAMTVHATDYSGVCSYCGNIAWDFNGTILTIYKVDGASSGDMCWVCDGNWNTYDSAIEQVIIIDGVSSIDDRAFENCSSLTNITIPNSVTSIGEYAFHDCSSLTNIVIPDSVTSLGRSAFYECTNLEDITLSDKISSIGSFTFGDCNNLTNIAIPNNVSSIGASVFYNCTNLENITLPDGVTSIGDSAFYNCTNLEKITLPNGVTCIEDRVFYECTNLKNIIIPQGVTSIGDLAFRDCNSLTAVVIPNSVSSIGLDAFWNCTNLTTITLPDEMVSIGDSAFYNCNSLKKITIPDGITSISDSLFSGCSSLTDITLPNGVTSIGIGAFYGCSFESIEIPNSVTSIGAGAFGYCSSLTNITIPNSVTSIDSGVFENCSGLTNITLQNGLTTINNNAFYWCNNLTSVTIPNSVISIGENAFYGCKMTSITIPNSVISIEEGAFCYCEDLTTVFCPCTLKEQVSTKMVFLRGNSYPYYPTINYTHPSPTITVNDTADTLSLVCESCGSTSTATLKAPIQTVFTGKPIEATCTGVSEDFAPAITYSGNKLVDGKPVYPGTYTATLTYGNKKVSLKYTITEAAAPAKPNKITNVVSGIHVYWPAVSGASKYGLWRSETGVNGTYKWIANPTVAHFTDTKVTSGKTYYYKVTTLDTVNNVHSAKSAAIGITYVATPDIKTRENKAAGVKLGWNKIVGATGYAIYRKPYSGNSDWVRVGTINNPSTLTWTDTSVKTNNGDMYKYTIRALAGSDRKTLSGCRGAGRTMVRLTSRTLNSATKASATSIKCSWSTTSQATGYQVRFMVGSTVYKTFTVGNYKTGVKTFTGLKAGQTYKIQVRTYKKVAGVGEFYSAWSTEKIVSL